jgi:hypothetical protein
LRILIKVKNNQNGKIILLLSAAMRADIVNEHIENVP